MHQSQESLYEQLRTLRILANRNGLYDAADFLRGHIEDIEKKLAEIKDEKKQSSRP